MEPCDYCACGLSDDEKEVKTTEVSANLNLSRIVRDYVLRQADLDDDSTFIQAVEICPEVVTAHYTDES